MQFVDRLFTLGLRLVTLLLAIPKIVARLASGQLGPTGNYYHADAAATFHISGNVVDDTQQPVAGAEVSLVDRGLDDKRSRRPERLRTDLGVSNPDGSINLRATYTWGTLTREPEQPPTGPQPFGIRVDSAGHDPNEQLFDLGSLQRGATDVFEILLGTVRLSRRP